MNREKTGVLKGAESFPSGNATTCERLDKKNSSKIQNTLCKIKIQIYRYKISSKKYTTCK